MSFAIPTSTPTAVDTVKLDIYKCSTCRRALFSSVQLQPHTDTDATTTKACGVYYSRFRPWMAESPSSVYDAAYGKLYCPGCGARAGTYSWAGQDCACGGFVSPAFAFSANSVDCTPTVVPRAAYEAALAQVAETAARKDHRFTQICDGTYPSRRERLRKLREDEHEA